MDELEGLLGKLSIFEKMYQFLRIVDPIEKKIYDLKDNHLNCIDNSCFDFWGKNEVCNNCISMRAFNEDDTIIKIEYKNTNIFMVTAIPIIINNRKLVVEFLKDTTNNLISEDNANKTNVQVITLIEYLNQAIVKDALTDQYNRRYINERLPVELINTAVNNEQLSIIFTDIDFFKKVNDVYGHIAGDEILKSFSKLLKDQIRVGKDWIARYGGEEFLICLTNTGLEQAKAIAERMRKTVETSEFLINDRLIHITSSFGVHTVCNENECLTMDGILEICDKKLYKAKSEGRNRVV